MLQMVKAMEKASGREVSDRRALPLQSKLSSGSATVLSLVRVIEVTWSSKPRGIMLFCEFKNSQADVDDESGP